MKCILLFFAFFAFHQGLFAAIETKQQTARISVDADAFPAYFRDFVRMLSSRQFPVKIGPVDSGDILESR